MLTYQVRPRIFRLRDRDAVAWPAKCLMRFHMQPEQPFGVSAGGGRTVVRAQPASMRMNANSGQHFATASKPLEPLEVRLEAPDLTVDLSGNVFSIRETCSSLTELEERILGYYFALPPLLNTKFADPPIVASVDGDIGGVEFRWELANWTGTLTTTTQDEQQRAVADSWDRLSIVAGLKGRRLLAALHYFHIAVRLDRSSLVVGEFMAETILNLAKTLEVLFPPSGGGKTREAIRHGLRQVGYSDPEIERLFLPAIALRNQIDVGHVSLALLTRDQLRAIHAYTEAAESGFRSMLEYVQSAVESGRITIPAYTDPSPSKGMLEVIDRLQLAFPAERPKESD